MNYEHGLSEKEANWQAPEEAEGEKELEDKVQDRVDQYFSSRLAEYITGMKPENPKIIERLSTDKDIIRAKYNLPNEYLSFSERERALLQIAKKLGVKIKPKFEAEKFFEENSQARGVYLDDSNEIATDIIKSSSQEYQKSLTVLEHELIHAIQNNQAKSMPIELMEYEAYIASVNIEYLKKNPEVINAVLFKMLIGGSVKVYYDLISKDQGQEVNPAWDNPEYFLQRDGLDLKQVQKYLEANKNKDLS